MNPSKTLAELRIRDFVVTSSVIAQPLFAARKKPPKHRTACPDCEPFRSLRLRLQSEVAIPRTMTEEVHQGSQEMQLYKYTM